MTNLPQKQNTPNLAAINAAASTRLRELNAEMESVHTAKLYRTVTLTRGDLRIQVHISRGRASGYYASAHAAGKTRSAWGMLPSDAIGKLISYFAAEGLPNMYVATA